MRPVEVFPNSGSFWWVSSVSFSMALGACYPLTVFILHFLFEIALFLSWTPVQLVCLVRARQTVLAWFAFRFRTTIQISNHGLTKKLKTAWTEGLEPPIFGSTADGLAARLLRSFFNSVSLQWMTLLKCKVALDATCPVTSSIFHFLINDGFVTSFFPFSCMFEVFDLSSTRNIKVTTTEAFEPLVFCFEVRRLSVRLCGLLRSFPIQVHFGEFLLWAFQWR